MLPAGNIGAKIYMTGEMKKLCDVIARHAKSLNKTNALLTGSHSGHCKTNALLICPTPNAAKPNALLIGSHAKRCKINALLIGSHAQSCKPVLC